MSNTKIEVKNDLESDCIAVLHTLTEEKSKDKSEARDEEKSGETVKRVPEIGWTSIN